MAKLTGQQREYFKDRIDNQFKITLGPLEKTAASKKADLVEEKYDEFVKDLGLTSTLRELAKAEDIINGVEQRVARHMSNLMEQYDMPSSDYGKKKYEWEWSRYESRVGQVTNKLKKMCKEECEIAFRLIPEGKEIEKLKNKKREAIDYIMGYDQQKELLDGLSKVLNGSGILMLEEYKEPTNGI